MKSIRTCLASALLIASASLPTPVSAQGAGADPSSLVLRELPDHLTVRFDQESGTPLDDFLVAAQRILDVPITYDANHVSGVRLRVLGTIAVPRDDFRAFVDRLVRKHGFVSWDAPDGEEPLVTVSKLHVSGQTRGEPLEPQPYQLVLPEDLDAEPRRITARYTTAFHFEHVDARAALAAFNPIFDHSADRLQNVSGGNALIATSISLDKLRAVRDLKQLIDVEAPVRPEQMGLEERYEFLEQRVLDLESRLDGESEGDR